MEANKLMVWAHQEFAVGNRERAIKLGNIANKMLDRKNEDLNAELINASIKLFLMCGTAMALLILLTKI